MSSRGVDGVRPASGVPRVRADDGHPPWPGPGRAGGGGSVGHGDREQPATRGCRGRFRRPATAPSWSPTSRRRVVDLTVSASGFAEAKRAGLVLEVGQTAAVEIELAVAGVRERVDVPVSVTGVDTTRSVVDAVIPSTAIEALPLNGRNFLELALLVPGNAPAPNFDPTKSNSVVISSAGQLGRGGNITIDGADNNDDVVGGPLQNVTQESVQEFQIATNRFTAESGRSASSVINVVTKSGTDQLRGSVSLFARDSRWQGLPATFDRSSGDSLPFDRQQLAGAAGGPLVAGEAVLVRRRRVPQPGWRRARRLARRRHPHHPAHVRAGARSTTCSARHASTGVRTAPTRSWSATPASTPPTPARAASTARSARRRSASAAATPTTRSSAPGRACSARALLNAATVSFSTFDNAIAPVASGPQLTFPSIQDGSSFRVPQGTTQKRLQVADTVTLVRGAHSLRAGGEWQRVDSLFDLGVFREGRDRARRGLRHLRPQRRRPGGRRRSAVRGDAAERPAGPGAGAARCRQQSPGALRRRTTGGCAPT